MTDIVGLVGSHGRVFIGGDSAGCSDDGTVDVRKDRKVFLLNAPDEPQEYKAHLPTMVVGGTTSFRILDLIQYKLALPPYHPDQHPKKYLVTAFVDALRDMLKTSGYDKKVDGEEQGGELLIGWNGQLYHIFEDYQVAQVVDDYDAVGSGAKFSKGAMFATQQLGMEPEQRILLALQAAEYHCQGIRPPFILESIDYRGSISQEREENL